MFLLPRDRGGLGAYLPDVVMCEALGQLMTRGVALAGDARRVFLERIRADTECLGTDNLLDMKEDLLLAVTPNTRLASPWQRFIYTLGKLGLQAQRQEPICALSTSLAPSTTHDRTSLIAMSFSARHAALASPVTTYPS